MEFDIFSNKTKRRIQKRLQEQDELRIHTTEVSKCLRREAFRLAGAPKLPSHFLGIKGWVGHTLIEKNIVEGKPISLDRVTVMEMPVAKKMQVDLRIANELQKVLNPMINNYWKWKKKTKLKLTPNWVVGKEIALTEPLRGKFILIGTIDILTKDHIVDFKMSKKCYLRAYKQQLGSYVRLARYNELGYHYVPLNVFLGGEEPEDYFPKKKSIESAMMYFDHDLQERLNGYEGMEEGVIPPCQVDFGCLLCQHRHLCRGV